jgi:SAM-dependent methyltransferase
VGGLLAARGERLSGPTAVALLLGRGDGSLSPVAMEHFDQDLPLIDVGCGDGVLTRQLAGHFRTVFGVDISPAAVAKARREHVLANVDYGPFNATDIAGARRLQARLGDANLHLRGVLHAMTSADWPAALTTLAVLAGERGRVFDIEISPEFSEVLRRHLARFGDLPSNALDVGRSGLGFEVLESLDGLYRDAGWRVLLSGELRGRSVMRLPDGNFFEYPFHYVLAAGN